MRPTMLAPLALAALLAPQGAGAAVDLNVPGALDAIRDQDPRHYERIDGILRAAEGLPCHTPEFQRAMKAGHEAEAARCSVMLMTSYPAKRRLSFTLERVRYVATVTMRDQGFDLRPAGK